ncbi:hypothetical protein BHC44_11150 [Snodgrassella alvi]|jgi:hypothetical protein|uniref:Glycosyltransferase n=1 Tax=Snodgrassella alvi TaxID=1196083 RepID=A0A2N9XU49_9NEIS|nr:hypothetical protein [Snodgrassella alvi]PIT51104.1 hypothetical protein BHC44_11150 [Snodgrassella alvi]PIT52891.1 hypothetical protein BHC49_11485 [Snodgrassella alvi]
MLPQSALASMYPVIMSPSHDGRYFGNYVQSLLALVAAHTSAGFPIQVFMHQGESLITRARNNCVAEFLAHPEWTHLCWIDTDIGFSPEAFQRLLLADRDIVAGVYPLKYESWPAEGIDAHMTEQQFNATYTRYTINISQADANNEVHVQIDDEGFIELPEAPTGFMVIKRQVFTRLMEAYPELQYQPDSLGVADHGYHYRFYDCLVDPVTKRYLSEDFSFCRLWNLLGGKVYVDSRSNLTHMGNKIYQGPFALSLEANLAYAIGAPVGARMFLHHNQPLQASQPPSK